METEGGSVFTGRLPLELELDTHQACPATHLSGPNQSFLSFADAARKGEEAPGPDNQEGAGEILFLVPRVSTGIPAPTQNLTCRRYSINIP